MREMVLNHASLFAPSARDSRRWLGNLARGLASLLDAGAVSKTLRMCRYMGDIRCGPGYSLFDACQSLRSHDRDGYKLLMGLAQKVPIEQGLASHTKERLLACESLQPSREDGEPLLLCVIADGIAVGFPSSPEWDRDRLHVEFEELLPNGDLDDSVEYIDNLARAAHAETILRHHRERRRAGATAEEVWARRLEAFPSLAFGPQVEHHLKAHAGLLPQILEKLVALDESARRWTDGPAPPWTTHVTPESENVKTTPKLRKARLFESQRGGRQPFYWHSRVGNGFRIHLRFDSRTRSIEIGYIGPHLPIK